MSPVLPKHWSAGPIADKLAITVLCVVATIAALTFRDYGLGWDDYTHSQYGDLLLSLYGSGFTDTKVFSFVNLFMYGGGFDMIAALVAKIAPFDLFETRRLVGAMIGVAGLLVTWRLGRRLGGPAAGLIALVLLATCPLYYGHMFINAKDAPFAVAMVTLLLGMVRAFEEYPQPQPATIALFGIGLGLTIGTRVIGGIAALYMLAAFAVLFIAESRALGVPFAWRRAMRFFVALLPGLALAYLVMGLVWPWSVLKFFNPLTATEYFSHFFEKPWKEMFDGALVAVPEMPRTYVPTLFFLQMPEILLAFGLSGIAGALVAVARGHGPAQHRAALMLVAVAATLPVALTVLARPAMYNGIRHFVFVTPPLAVMGGVAGAWLIERIKPASRWAAASCVAIFLACVASPAIDMVRLHPYQYTHFNRIAGGVRSADEHYMIDYWGLAFKQASQELRAQLPSRLDRPWRVAVCGPNRPAAVELGPEFITTWDSKGADFALSLGEFYCAELRAPVLVSIKREGVTYARVYDIRERQVLSLFTIPPVN